MLILQMKMRANFLRGAIVPALLIVAIVAFIPFAAAQTVAPKLGKSQAGFYRLRIADFEITALSDGTVPLPIFNLLTNIKPVEIE